MEKTKIMTRRASSDNPVSRSFYFSALKIVPLFLLMAESSMSAAVYSAVNDFSLNGNPNGPWSYLDNDALLAESVVGTGAVSGLIAWANPVIPNFGSEGVGENISGSTFLASFVVPTDHLYYSTATNNVTVRFTVPSSGSYSVAGDFLGIDTAQISHNVAILVNGTQVFSGTIASYKQSNPFGFTQPFKSGDVVDFVNYGISTAGSGLFTGLAAIITPVPATPPVYDAVHDFSLNGNPNGVWSYLASNVLMSAGAEGATPGFIVWGNGLGNPDSDSVIKNISGSTISPEGNYYFTDHLGLNAEIGNVTIRFTAPSAATYAITGNFVGATVTPEPHNAGVLVNGSQVYSGPIASFNQPDSFNLTETLNAGDTVDFVDYAGANYQFLNTGLAATVTLAAPPSILPSGVVPVFSSATTIQPGSWASIYGSNLAAGTTLWNGTFPTMLGGTTVTVNGKNAYLWFVSPGQINFQAPNDTATGTVPVVVTTGVGSSSSTVTLEPYGPSFSLLNSKYATAVVLTSGPGNSGGGYDIIGPVGAFPYPTRPVKPGETVVLYGVGFGPTKPPVLAGQLFSGDAPSPVLPQITIGGVQAQVAFTGIVEAGLFQLNVVVPNAGSGDQLLQATIGGVTTQNNVFITLQ